MDYEIDYKIGISEQDEPELINRIRSSGHFDADVYSCSNGYEKGDPYAFCSPVEGIWSSTCYGYKFGRMGHGTSANATYDTVANAITYQEMGD